MATQKQIEANRRNARRSTGPRTEEGRRASSLNAIKHGLRSRLTVIPGEDQAEFQDLFDRYVDLFQPQNIRDLDAVHKVVTCQWRLRRVAAIEAEMFSQTIQARLRAPVDSNEALGELFAAKRAGESGRPGASSAASLASRFLGGDAKHLNTVARYEASLERAQQNAFRYLDSRPLAVFEEEPDTAEPDQPHEPDLTANGAGTWKSAREQYDEATRFSGEPASPAASTASGPSDPDRQAKPNEPKPAAQTHAPEPEIAGRTQSPGSDPLPGAPGGALAA